MENQDTTPFLPEANQASSETERYPDIFPYDNDEEMVLLQMTEVNDAPPMPGLKAAMEKSRYPNETVNQRQSMPLFMERPKSSGIDVTAFCFAKPSGRNFSVKSSKPSTTKPSAREPVQGKSGPTEGPAKQNEARSGDSDFAHVESQTRHSPHSDTGHQYTPRTCSPAATQVQSVQGLDEQANSSVRRSSSSDHSDEAQAQAEGTVGPMQTTLVDVHDPESILVEPQNAYSQDKRHGGNTRVSISRTNTPKTTVMSRPPSSHTPLKDGLRVSKRRRTHSRKPTGRKPSAPRPVDNENSQLTEDDLFQILIMRIRQREEDNTAAANLRKQLEATASQLAEENEALRAELGAYGAQLQKKTLESKTYRAQMNTWKTKLGKFKHVLNVLGTDYQNLRGESIHLKAARSALDKEGKEIRGGIDGIRAQISKVTTSVGEKKNHVLESETIINTLRNDLKHSNEKARSVENQLHEERKRVMMLESYIQCHSLAQEKQLGLIRANHLGMNQKMDSAFEAMAKLWESSQTSIRSIMSPTMERCLLAINSLSEKESLDNVEIQKFADTINGFISRMDTVVPQLAKDSEKSAEANDIVRTFFKEQLQSIENRFGVDCDLHKQFSAIKEACGSLHEKLEIMGPGVCTLNATIQGVEEKESGLVRRIEEFEQSLTEARDLARQPPPVPENENYSVTAEIMSQLEKISEELVVAQETLQTKDTENEHVKHSLLETTEALQEAETRVASYEAKVGALQQQAQSAESKIREELSRASVIARDQNRAKFEQRLHGVLKEKEAVEKDLEKTKELLVTAQQAQLQTDALTEQHQKELEPLLLAKEQEIETLRNSTNESDSKFAAQETELTRLSELESLYTSQKDLLRQEIDEANQKISTLEAETALSKVDQLASQELEKKFDELQAEFSRKEEERLSIQKDLTAADTAKSALESGKAKAKGEIHALLLRVQDSERWMKAIKEKLGNYGISTSTESFPETWSKLETLLQSAIASGFPDPSSNASLQQVSCTPAVASMPQKGGESPDERFVQTTEVIYRTHNIPRSAYCSPAGRDSLQSGDNSTIETVPDSQMSTNIVPFSSFQTQLSPMHCSSNHDDHDASELADILTQLPQREHPAKGCNDPADDRSERSSSSTTEKGANSLSPWKRTGMNNSNPKTSEVRTPITGLKFNNSANDAWGINNTGDKQKAVTFEDQKIANTGSKRRTPESSHRETPNRLTENFERRPVRQNRRTYSRHRQTSPAREQGGPEDMRANGELPYNGNKRARVSTAFNYPRSQRQAQGAAEPVERRLSPASLASGSSRQNTANEDPANKRWTGRNQKRPGRKTRGERYSARFSENGGAR